MKYLEAYIKTLDKQTAADLIGRQADLAELEAKLKQPYKEAIQNIVTSSELRIAINKACNEQRPALEVLDLALQAIAAMTGDKTFYQVNIAKIKEAKP